MPTNRAIRLDEVLRAHILLRLSMLLIRLQTVCCDAQPFAEAFTIETVFAVSNEPAVVGFAAAERMKQQAITRNSIN